MMRSDGENDKQWVPRRRLNHFSHFGEGLGVSSKEEIRIAASAVPSQAFALQKCVHLCPRKHECECACSQQGCLETKSENSQRSQNGRMEKYTVAHSGKPHSHGKNQLQLQHG